MNKTWKSVVAVQVMIAPGAVDSGGNILARLLADGCWFASPGKPAPCNTAH